MPFVPVPKDLTKVKTKLAFNLTKRQLLCFGSGIIIGVPVYLLTRGSIGNEAAALLMMILVLPFFAFGIYEKDGQPLEKVLKNYINVTFIRPPNRPYRTDNGYAAIMRQADLYKEVDKNNIKNKTTEKTGNGAARGKKSKQKG